MLLERGPKAALETVRAVAGAAIDTTIDTTAETLALFGQDIFSRGAEPLAVFRPGDIDTLSRGIAAAAEAGLAVVPRGGGMSYTSGYLADAPGAILIDTAAMDRVLAVDEADMRVTVEAGCTWRTLYDNLHARGLRTPCWGTLSGRNATVGGGMSQNGGFWGGRTGSIAASALGFEVVLADGSVARTGNDTVRPFGPDMTGLFAADCGAFGVKAHITLALEREPEALAYGSFAFETAGGFTAAASAIARAGLASESFGFDPFLQAQRMKRESLADDAKALVGMMKAQGGFWRGLKEGAKVAKAGRGFLDQARFSIHCIAEGRSSAAADADMAAIREIARREGGREVENTIPKMARANPFPPVNSMLGPAGERWVPVHGVVRHSRALATIEAITELFETNREEMDRLAVGAGYMFLTIGTTAFLIEPVLYWPDAQDAIHKHSVEPAHLARLTDFPSNPEARTLVEQLREAIVAIFTDMDAIHFQIGRTYPLECKSDPLIWKTLRTIKRELDPDGRMNPGVLGL